MHQAVDCANRQQTKHNVMYAMYTKKTSETPFMGIFKWFAGLVTSNAMNTQQNIVTQVHMVQPGVLSICFKSA